MASNWSLSFAPRRDHTIALSQRVAEHNFAANQIGRCDQCGQRIAIAIDDDDDDDAGLSRQQRRRQAVDAVSIAHSAQRIFAVI